MQIKLPILKHHLHQNISDKDTVIMFPSTVATPMSIMILTLWILLPTVLAVHCYHCSGQYGCDDPFDGRGPHIAIYKSCKQCYKIKAYFNGE